MKILIITSTVAEYISVGNIARELCHYLRCNDNDVKLIYLDNTTELNTTYDAAGGKFEAKLYQKMALITNYYYRFRPMAENRLKKLIEEFNPDIIQIIQLNQVYMDYIKLFKMLSNSNKICVYTMIDEEPYLADCDNAYECTNFVNGCEFCKGQNEKINKYNHGGKWSNRYGSRRLAKIKKIAYDYMALNKLCFVAPEWVVSRAKISKLLSNRQLYVVDEYVDNINVYYPRFDYKEICNRYNIDINKKLIINIAKYSNSRKGVAYYVDLARLFENDESYQFINIGFDGDKNILPDNYVAIPFIKNQDDLAKLLSAADLHIITSISDTMPNICLEALSCGTPTCGFDITGIPYVAEEPIGTFVKPRDINALERVVRKIVDKKSEDIINKCRNYALDRYSPQVYVKKMIEVYKDMLLKERGEIK